MLNDGPELDLVITINDHIFSISPDLVDVIDCLIKRLEKNIVMGIGAFYVITLTFQMSQNSC